MNRKASFQSTLQAFLYLLPMFTIIAIFIIYPIIKSIDMSFYTEYNIFTGIVEQRGWDNYLTIFKDPQFYKALKNTALYVLCVVPSSLAISLLIAVLLNQIPWLKGFFRTVYFLPFVTSTVAISIVWSWLFHSQYGLINYFLSWFGVDGINWLNSSQMAMPAVIIMAIWKGLGFNILLLLVGLGNIDESYYKAAKVDGANAWQRFFRITLPLLRPTIFLLTVVSVINGFKVFDEVFALFNGRPGPAGSATTLVYYLYRKFYEQYDYGMAAATGMVLFGIVLLLTLIQYFGNRYFEKRGG
ncbi:multiple sugar transport system permease protein [Facklamia miroungae]|uniref:Multiple sugar transport system permease protein n=2 Tax=Facklamia miroungae TaxID=120956 RepID=A0A1G7V2I3_9LACT|nr:sugar ABC transporter permease [Facklamia miroungae]SDG53983.1 multiple sugar transport system permease protein [Facklamia miroungae]